MEWPDVVDLIFEQCNRTGAMKKYEKEFKGWMLRLENYRNMFDALMYNKLFFIDREKLSKNNDYVIAVVGKEGEGKSTFAAQLCSVIDPDKFNVDHMCLTEIELFDNFLHNTPKQAMSIDEGAFMLFSRDAMTTLTKKTTKLFMTIRQKRLFITICIPSYKSLDKYIRQDRIGMLIDIRQKGDYQAYVGPALEKVNRDLHKVPKIGAIRVPMEFSWTGHWNKNMPPCVDVEKYDAKKTKHVDDFIKSLAKEFKEKSDIKMIPSNQAAEQLSLNHDTLTRYFREGKLKGQQVDRRWFMSKKLFDDILKNGIPAPKREKRIPDGLIKWQEKQRKAKEIAKMRKNQVSTEQEIKTLSTLGS